ncbi:pro-sigmaK processing inhibitor BofA family protein [Priestia aryabhattai]|uniref:pro-sigmaK processing inhibitor BofA family protein n=1 Tax=Priestia aryabhattai TaxID=412384 RepID=UPI0023B0BF23|nr:pro-sigmaK processing inhibitor BofA family protein [Priestia aryabhattai]MDE8676402.1 pro-sigmaK processing inhibitor BofA family protein [Priestia aryabhattai]
MLNHPIVVVSFLIGLIILLLVTGGVEKMLRVIGNLSIKLIIGVLLLFFINIFGVQFGIHIPINSPTAIVSAILGIPGIAALLVINNFIL